MATSRIDLPMDKIGAFCRKWKVNELSLFGSALRDDFSSDSDLDFLVTFADDADWSLLDHAAMELELVELLGREVDLVSRRGIERSGNELRKGQILATARSIYRAA